MDQLVLPNHDLLYQLAAAQLQLVWAVKGGCNLTTCIAYTSCQPAASVCL